MECFKLENANIYALRSNFKAMNKFLEKPFMLSITGDVSLADYSLLILFFARNELAFYHQENVVQQTSLEFGQSLNSEKQKS